MISVGIDAGSRAVKLILLDEDERTVVASRMTDQGIAPEAIARRLLADTLAQCGLSAADLRRLVATGYARHSLSDADAAVTEITCHARGVRHLLPETRTIIEIGGQDSKLLRLDDQGSVYDFSMNDRCAAGSGRFLEVIAARLGVELAALGDLAAGSTSPAAISSTCVVFAESEIIGLLAAGSQAPDIAAGVNAAIAARVSTMAAGAISPPVVFTGGVALLPSMAQALERALSHPLIVAPQPHFTGALGAALLAAAHA